MSSPLLGQGPSSCEDVPGRVRMSVCPPLGGLTALHSTSHPSGVIWGLGSIRLSLFPFHQHSHLSDRRSFPADWLRHHFLCIRCWDLLILGSKPPCLTAYRAVMRTSSICDGSPCCPAALVISHRTINCPEIQCPGQHTRVVSPFLLGSACVGWLHLRMSQEGPTTCSVQLQSSEGWPGAGGSAGCELENPLPPRVPL